jgi:hypothetical protein
MLVDAPCVPLLGTEVGFSQSVVNLGFPLSPSLSWNRMDCQVSGWVASTLRKFRSSPRLHLDEALLV